MDEPEFPHELAAYCERRNINGLPLLSLLGRVSILLAKSTTDNSDAHYPVARHYFSYLLGYAIWVGEKHHKLKFCDIENSQRILAQLPLNVFPKGSVSQNIAEFIHCAYRDANFLPLANRYFGPFRTNVPLDKLASKFNSYPVFVNAICKRYGWNEDTFHAALRQAYDPVPVPSYFFEEEDPIGREFWNCLLVAVVSETECNWTHEEEMQKWPMDTMLLSEAAQTTRMVVIQSSDLHSF